MDELTVEIFLQTKGAACMRVLVICNAYPSEQAKYRNGFIHRRVKSYQEAGIDVQIFYEHAPALKSYTYQYEEVPVRVGNHEALEREAATGDYDAFLVHFPEPSRIEPLKRLGTTRPIIVWIHGYEAEAWYRRWFNFVDDPSKITEAITRKDTYFATQNAFLRDLIEDAELNLSFVNVSKWFQEFIVEPDVGAQFHNSVVIPNIVDEKLFYPEAKDAAQRKRILTIRPFASRKYANDQTVAAILELSQRPYFEDLEFTVCGQGELFSTITAPLRNFSNVTLKEAFFSHNEIKALHSSHGVFLSPTRFDSQGVSMCEAMSSGLATISTDISAIPEYVQHMETGLLAQPESPKSIADNIERLYFDEDLFQSIAQKGSAWMTEHCGHEATIAKEIALMRDKVHGD